MSLHLLLQVSFLFRLHLLDLLSLSANLFLLTLPLLALLRRNLSLSFFLLSKLCELLHPFLLLFDLLLFVFCYVLLTLAAGHVRGEVTVSDETLTLITLLGPRSAQLLMVHELLDWEHLFAPWTLLWPHLASLFMSPEQLLSTLEPTVLTGLRLLALFIMLLAIALLHDLSALLALVALSDAAHLVHAEL